MQQLRHYILRINGMDATYLSIAMNTLIEYSNVKSIDVKSQERAGQLMSACWKVSWSFAMKPLYLSFIFYFLNIVFIFLLYMDTKRWQISIGLFKKQVQNETTINWSNNDGSNLSDRKEETF